MRVTKAVKEYIHQEVEKAIRVKYSAELAEYENRRRAREASYDLLNEAAISAVRQQLNQILEGNSMLVKNADYNDKYDKLINSYWFSGMITFPEDAITYINSTIRDEVRQVEQDIIVELELGASRDELRKMLAEIGK